MELNSPYKQSKISSRREVGLELLSNYADKLKRTQSYKVDWWKSKEKNPNIFPHWHKGPKYLEQSTIEQGIGEFSRPWSLWAKVSGSPQCYKTLLRLWRHAMSISLALEWESAYQRKSRQQHRSLKCFQWILPTLCLILKMETGLYWSL